MADSWSDRRPSQRRSADPLEQRFDRLVSAGRQLVDGVSGARPGARPQSRGEARLPRLDGLGRWVENKLDWILEDEDDWREPWQEGRSGGVRPERRPAEPSDTSAVPSRRRPLEAISRRRESAEWPDDASFSVPRWQRQASGAAQAAAPSPRAAASSPRAATPSPRAASSALGGTAAGVSAPQPSRSLPRSTRRRVAG